MAVINGMVCITCELHGGEKIARHDSHFCSKACRREWERHNDGPVQCVYCTAEEETIAEAKSNGWTSIEKDPEGSTWNALGYCPDCKDRE